MVKKLLALPYLIFATQLVAQNSNTINTAVPFLRITPDARAGAIGDAGIALSPNGHSIFWNTAKLAFIQDRFGISTTYSPWPNISGNVYLADASAYWKIDSNNAITGSIRYFNLGKLTITNASGVVLQTVHPNEYTLHFGYGRKFTRDLSIGINIGYVRSYLGEGYAFNNGPLKPGKSLMADLSIFYTHPIKRNSHFSNYKLGLTISNLGGKIRYYSSATGDFLPANLGFGSAFNFQFGKDHQLSFALDLNKLLVPTPDSSGNYRNESVAEGVFKSFADAPDGLHEELREVTVSMGAEYWWKKMIALRTGYFYESKYKGARSFFTVGAGIKYHFFQFDYSYVIGTSEFNTSQDGSMRFGLSCNLNSFRKNPPKKL